MTSRQRHKKPSKDGGTDSDAAKKPVAGKTTGSKGSSILFAIQITIVLVVAFFSLSYMVTETWNWGIRSRFTNIEYYKQQFRTPLNLSESELRQYDGSDPLKPVYLAIEGDVYDVSHRRKLYGAGGSYAFFAGVDAARAYVSGCFKQDLTHDLRGIDESKLEGLESWKQFYRNHDKYVWVGRVWHPPIDPASPPPQPCGNIS
jgi:predicted heme/steroid binding protein